MIQPTKSWDFYLSLPIIQIGLIQTSSTGIPLSSPPYFIFGFRSFKPAHRRERVKRANSWALKMRKHLQNGHLFYREKDDLCPHQQKDFGNRSDARSPRTCGDDCDDMFEMANLKFRPRSILMNESASSQLLNEVGVWV